MSNGEGLQEGVPEHLPIGQACSEVDVASAQPRESAVLGPEVRIRIWSPIKVGVYSVVLAYPCALMLAVRNWKAMKQENRIWPHVIGAVAVTLPLIVVLYINGRVGRLFCFGVNVSAFAYLREKLRSDIAEFKGSNPAAVVSTRPWYSAIGWVLLALTVFFAIAVPIGLLLDMLGID